jgi:hypothetical protein
MNPDQVHLLAGQAAWTLDRLRPELSKVFGRVGRPVEGFIGRADGVVSLASILAALDETEMRRALRRRDVRDGSLRSLAAATG